MERPRFPNLINCLIFLFLSLRHTIPKLTNYRSAAAATTAAAADIMLLLLLLCLTDATVPKPNPPLPKMGLRNLLPAGRRAPCDR